MRICFYVIGEIPLILESAWRPRIPKWLTRQIRHQDLPCNWRQYKFACSGVKKQHLPMAFEVGDISIRVILRSAEGAIGTGERSVFHHRLLGTNKQEK